MKPYYQDDQVTLYHGDALEVAAGLSAQSVQLLLTDPPYFNVKDDDWDRQWAKRRLFLEWMGQWMDIATWSLTGNASVFVFAAPEMAWHVEQVVGDRFNVLNSIRWMKTTFSTARRNDPANLRSFLSLWEAVIFAERRSDMYAEQSKELHREVFAPVGDYMRLAREAAGFSRREAAQVLTGYKNEDSANANVFNWELGKNLIGERDYQALQTAYNGHLSRTYMQLCREYDELRREYDELRREYDELRRPFHLRDRSMWGDVWTVESVPDRLRIHSCEKPSRLLEHIITTTTKPGDVVLDLFAGSGSALQAARDTGRKAIGVELEERYCELIAKRLDQMAFDFGEGA